MTLFDLLSDILVISALLFQTPKNNAGDPCSECGTLKKELKKLQRQLKTTEIKRTQNQEEWVNTFGNLNKNPDMISTGM